nr:MULTISPECIES: ABC transporter substrate-binding protein [unclassified Rhizobium]
MTTVALGGSAAFAQQPTADVVHWLTAGAESEAVTLLAKEYEKRGGKWIDSAAPGGPTDAQAMIMNRIAGGNPPGVAFLAIGHSAVELGKEGLLRDVKDIAAKNGLDVTSKVMIKLATDSDNAIYALPIAVETDNLAWFSKPVFDAAGLQFPKSWTEFLDQAKLLKEKGFIPIAVGAQGWQLNILFNSILLGQGGDELYDAVVNKKDATAAGSDKVVAAFVTLRALSAYSDAGASNRAWNDTLNLVAEGKAGMQVMGSWAGAELKKMGVEYGTKWGCALPPGNTKLVIEGAGFQFPKVKNPDEVAGQDLFIQVMMDPKLEADFAAVKGAIPARLDADTSKLSACDQLAAKTMRDAGSYPALGTVLSNESGGQIEDLMSRFWSDPSLTPEDAAKQFAGAITASN